MLVFKDKDKTEEEGRRGSGGTRRKGRRHRRQRRRTQKGKKKNQPESWHDIEKSLQSHGGNYPPAIYNASWSNYLVPFIYS